MRGRENWMPTRAHWFGGPLQPVRARIHSRVCIDIEETWAGIRQITRFTLINDKDARALEILYARIRARIHRWDPRSQTSFACIIRARAGIKELRSAKREREREREQSALEEELSLVGHEWETDFWMWLGRGVEELCKSVVFGSGWKRGKGGELKLCLYCASYVFVFMK